MTVAMELGYTEVPCAVVDIDKTREKALNIALNKITGAWDDSLLADLLKDIEDSNFDLGKTGFEPPEIETLFNKVHSKEVKEDDFDVESELKQPCFSKEGDLWHLGKHIVLCGDSTKAECYNTLMDGTKANLVLSDPPYNVDVEETAGKIMNDNMGDSEFYQFLLAAFQQMHDHLADDGSIYIFHNSNLDLFSLEMFEDLAWLMARHADPAKVPDSPEEFLDQFNTFSIYQILPQLIELWGLNVQTEVESRKNLAKVSGK